MAKTEFKLVRKPQSPNIQKRIVRQEVISKLKPVAKAAKESYDKVVDNWSNKPAFKDEIKVTTDSIEVIISVRRGQKIQGSDATVADLWKWINETGTRPHVIRPKRQGRVLSFPWGGPGSYQSKTGANPARYGGSGTVRNAQPTFRTQVNHPGFKPRKFSDAINRDLQQKFRQAVDSGYRSGLKKAQKNG